MGKLKNNISFDPEDLFADALKEYKKNKIKENGKVYDVISFTKEILNQKPFPTQELILKFFYAGSKHNENLIITDKDMELIDSWSVPHEWLTRIERSKLKILRENLWQSKLQPVTAEELDKVNYDTASKDEFYQRLLETVADPIYSTEEAQAVVMLGKLKEMLERNNQLEAVDQLYKKYQQIITYLQWNSLSTLSTQVIEDLFRNQILFALEWDVEIAVRVDILFMEYGIYCKP